MRVLLSAAFSPVSWSSWGLAAEPLLRAGMPVLIDVDLKFADEAGPRPAAVVNRWLRELPVSGAPAQRTWVIYAEVLRQWLMFLASYGVDVFHGREELRLALSSYAGQRLSGPPEARLADSTWNLHIGVLSAFYQWAIAEGYASAVPFNYRQAVRITEGRPIAYQRNLALLKKPKPHSTIKFLEPDFARIFVNALAGLCPDGSVDLQFRGRELGRNAAMGQLVLASGLRLKEFTHLLVYEIPGLPSRRNDVPVPLGVAGPTAKGGKARTTWVSYDALAAVHGYIDFERASHAHGSVWQPEGEPLLVHNPDWEGAVINGRRRSWRTLTTSERLRLVAPGGGSCLLALRTGGAPFLDWPTVFRRTAQRIRRSFEPRFPHVAAHRLRHSFAMRTLELLTIAFYQQAAALVKDTDANAGLALYLTKADPWEILRDLLGHSSVLTTQIYVQRLDVTRIFRQAYLNAGITAGLLDPQAVAEAEAEFTETEGF